MTDYPGNPKVKLTNITRGYRTMYGYVTTIDDSQFWFNAWGFLPIPPAHPHFPYGLAVAPDRT